MKITLDLPESGFDSRDPMRRRATVSARELSIPPEARREYEEAQKDLARRDADAAAAHLERAVEIAPQFSVAWNNVGTIAYQTGRYEQAERYFRKSLEEDPSAYEPLVNLGGVLINLHKLEEARQFNQYAVLSRPHDALANSQMGMTYFGLGKMELAEKYLKTACEIDPGHFSHPQLLLAEIYLRRNERAAAANVLDDYVRRHPDDRDAAKIRAAVQKLRQ